MDIWTLLRTALRRWYVTVPVLAGCLTFGYLMGQQTDPVYTAQSSAVLTGPKIVPDLQREGETNEINPFLSLGGALTTTTEVVVVLMDSASRRLAYSERGLEPDYQVDRFDAVFFFDVTGPEPDAVVATANTLVAIADEEMAGLQEAPDAAPETRVRVVPVSLPSEAIEDDSGGVKLFAVIGIVGAVLAIGAAAALDGFLRWRTAARRRRHDEVPAGAPLPKRGNERAPVPTARPATSEQGVVVAAADHGAHRAASRGVAGAIAGSRAAAADIAGSRAAAAELAAQADAAKRDGAHPAPGTDAVAGAAPATTDRAGASGTARPPSFAPSSAERRAPGGSAYGPDGQRGSKRRRSDDVPANRSEAADDEGAVDTSAVKEPSGTVRQP